MAGNPTIRVVSWNIEHGLEVDRAIDALSNNPDLKDADLILLQEMDDVGPQRIAEALGLQATYRAGCTIAKTGKPFGNAILARGSIGEVVTFNLSHKALLYGSPRIGVTAPVTIEPKTGGAPLDLFVCSVHAEVSTLSHRKQLVQYDEIVDRLTASDSNVIVGGDFNTASHRSIEGLVTKMGAVGLDRLLPAGQQTFFRFGRPFELDHLFSSGFSVVDAGVSRGHEASDHDPVWAVLESTRISSP